MALTNLHPLDPLTGDEILIAVDIVKKVHGEVFFQAVTLLEPRKAEMVTWLDGKADSPPPARLADVTAIGQGGKVYDGFINIATASILKWEELNGVQPIVRLLALGKLAFL